MPIRAGVSPEDVHEALDASHGNVEEEWGQCIQLLEVTQQLWGYCLSRRIMHTAEHLPGHLNQAADTQSRIYNDSSNWQLMPEVFKQLDKL